MAKEDIKKTDQNNSDNKKWSELQRCERSDLENKKNRVLDSNSETINKYNFKMYDWYFLLSDFVEFLYK